METITKKQFLKIKHVYFMQIVDGAVFVYPTDTIYGIGCDATNNEAVKRIRTIKKRTKQPFSVIAPSKEWIDENCHITALVEEYLNKLPGHYTFILKLKNKSCVAKDVVSDDTLGVRLPHHWISTAVKEINKPIITTSLNLTGKPFINLIKDIEKSMKEKIDFAITDGKLKNKPSKVFDLTGKEAVQLR